MKRALYQELARARCRVERPVLQDSADQLSRILAQDIVASIVTPDGRPPKWENLFQDGFHILTADRGMVTRVLHHLGECEECRR